MASITEHRLANITFCCWLGHPAGYYASAWQSGGADRHGVEIYQTGTHETTEAVSAELHSALCRALRVPATRVLVDDHGQRLGHGHLVGI